MRLGVHSPQDPVDLRKRTFNAADVSAGRLNALQGVYWGTAGLLILVVTLLGAFPDGNRPVIYAIGAAALLSGFVLFLPQLPEFPGPVHAALSLFGGITTAGGTYVAGPTHRELASLMAVYVTSFAFVLARRYIPLIVPVSALAHLGVLLWVDAPGAWGMWVGTWGVSIVAGWIAGAVVEAHRDVLAHQEQLLDELAEAGDAKTALLHAVSHELSRPMTSMRGLAETLATRGEDLPAESRVELAERIGFATERLHEMLDELLGLGRLSTGRVSLDLQPITVRELVDLAVSRADLELNGISVSAPQDLEVVVDRSRLSHALSNLLTNAHRYGGDGPITVVAEAKDDEVEVRVTDRGPGVPDEAKQEVFEPFIRAREEHVERGSGIGLSLVAEFLRLHGGRAWIEDAVGGGTVAAVRFPRQVAASGPADSAPQDG